MFVESMTKFMVLCSMLFDVVVCWPVSLVNISLCIRVCSSGISLVYMVYSMPDNLLPCMTLQFSEFSMFDRFVSISTNCFQLVGYDWNNSSALPLMP